MGRTGGRGLLLAFLVFACLCLREGVQAWGASNHERIFKIATKVLSSKQYEQVRHMLHSDLIDVAAWELEMTNKYPETEALHWHRQEPEWFCELTGKKPDESQLHHLGNKDGNIRCDDRGAEGSLFCGLAYFFEHFATESLLKEFPVPEVPINTPKELQALGKLGQQDLTPRNYLKWLMILIGDLHQPLHWLKEHSYGKAVQVQYQGNQYSLLQFWEDILPRSIHVQDTPAESLQKQYATRSSSWWYKMPTELFRIWAKETAEVVCSQVYAAMEQKQEDGSRRVASPFVLNDEMFHRWLELANDFTLLAGQRLAFVLDDILEHRRHKHAAKEGRGHRHHGPRKRRWQMNLGTNLLITVVFVPMLLMLFRLHEKSGGFDFLGLFKDHLKN